MYIRLCMVQVSGIDDDAEEAGVKVYMLRKITNNLPLDPVLVALK